MSMQYPSTAVRVRGTLDYRRFGAQCLTTAHIDRVGALCFSMVGHLDAMNQSARHSLRFTSGNHVTLVVAGLFSEEPSEDEIAVETIRYSDALEQFNWNNLMDRDDRRFHLCTLLLLGPEQSQEMQESGVVMQSTRPGCPSCKGLRR